MDDRATAAAPTDKPWLFARGNTAYRARQDRIAAKFAELAEEYDTSGAATRSLLRVAATHLYAAEAARNSLLRSRATRAALKILATLQRKPEPPPKPLEEYVRGATK
jgi:hypothetical protein